MVRISKPKLERDNGKIRFYVDIKGLEIDRLWYEMPKFIEPYINVNDSSPFLVALLPQIAIRGGEIAVEGSISGTLYNSIVTKLFPLWNKYSSIYKQVTLKVESLIKDSPSTTHKRYIGTGVSCGVDSLDTIKTTLEYSKENRIDTLTFFNTGSHRNTSGLTIEESRRLFYGRMSRSKQCAQELNLDFLWVDSNVGEFLKTKYVQTHQFCNFSAVMACGSYFSKYYYSSGYPLDMFDITYVDKDTAYYETYLCQLLSTENVHFVISGECKSRLDKVKNIADMPIAQKYLNVCFMDNENCGLCEKCVRTQMELYSIRKLDAFSDVFDTEKFYQNLGMHLKRTYGSQYNMVYIDVIKSMKSNEIRVPLIYKLYGTTLNILRRIKHLLK